jgi:DNA repair protein RecO (recombination protein O)
MIRKDEGIVLKTAPSGETSRLVTFLGRGSGKVRLVAKGALKPASPLRGAVEPGNHIEVLYYFKENRSRYYIKEANVLSTLDARRDSLSALALALAVLEIVDAVAFWESPEPRIVGLVCAYFARPDPEDPVLFFLAFEFGLLGVLGALPDFSACAACGESPAGGFFDPEQGSCACARHGSPSPRRIAIDEGAAELLAALGKETLAETARRRADPGARKRLGSILHWTYTHHVENYRLPESLNLLPKE